MSRHRPNSQVTASFTWKCIKWKEFKNTFRSAKYVKSENLFVGESSNSASKS